MGMAMKHTVDKGGPSPDEIVSALEELSRHTTTTPTPSPILTLQEARIEAPIQIGNVTITSFMITSGNPENGALRSDDHVSLWETVFPSRESCPDCSGNWREYMYTSHHNINGRSKETCQICEHTFESQEWG